MKSVLSFFFNVQHSGLCVGFNVRSHTSNVKNCNLQSVLLKVELLCFASKTPVEIFDRIHLCVCVCVDIVFIFLEAESELLPFKCLPIHRIHIFCYLSEDEGFCVIICILYCKISREMSSDRI